MKTRIFFIMLCLLIVLTSCTEDDDHEEPNETEGSDTSYIANNLKKHFYKNHTTWIYESLSGEKDTVTLLNKDYEILDPMHIHGYPQTGYVENYKFNYESTRDGFYWDQYIGFVIVRNGIDWANGEYIYLSSYKIGDSSDEAIIDTIFNNYEVSNTSFQNVVRIRIDNFEFETGENWYYYFADSIGIIKKEKITDESNRETWNLIKRTE